mgnify:CR=1 FL=1
MPTKKISLKIMTLNNNRQKINDCLGNPVEIGIAVTWRVVDTAKAVFEVDNYKEFLSLQCDSALRNIVRLYPYDVAPNVDTTGDGIADEGSLRGSSEGVVRRIKEEIQSRVEEAGLEIVDADYDHENWLSQMTGLENEPERGGRCLKCFKLRLLRTAEYARKRGIKVITTTLASSRWKSLDQINEAGQWACDQEWKDCHAPLAMTCEAAMAPVRDEVNDGMPLGAVDGSRLGVETVPPDDSKVIWWDQNWRKGGLQERRLQIIKEYDFYNQLYCGCEFSKHD